MIDQQWLDGALRFELQSGERVKGVGGVGGSNVVMRYQDTAGKEWALRLPKSLFLFPSYIHEVPNSFAPSVQYDVGRLNRKLGSLVGDIQVYILVEAFNELFTSLIDALAADAADLDIATGESDEATRALRFLLQTPVFDYRLAELESGRYSREERDWAAATRQSIQRLPHDRGLRAGDLLENPLPVWGGAVLEGYFISSEIPTAAAAIRQAMDKVPGELVQPFLDQASFLLEAVAARDPSSPGFVRVAALYDATGLFSWRFIAEGEELPADSFLMGFGSDES
jgi:hypothetical protein